MTTSDSTARSDGGMIDYADALRSSLERTPRASGRCDVPLSEALGRALAEDVRSDVDVPPFDRSAMDGFAVRAADVANTPISLTVVGTVPAGGALGRRIGAGEAAAVMTGAPVPEGSDAVVQVEWTSGFGAAAVTVERAVATGDNVSPRGQILRAGAKVLRAGTAIGVEEISLLAAVGCDPVPAGPLPSVAVLSTGDELVPPSVVPGPSQIRNVNGPALAAFCRGLGLEPAVLGVVPDDPPSIREALAVALEHDVVLMTGGVSEGAFDYVEDTLGAAGVEIGFRRVAIKPGKPTVFGTRGGTILFALPGNPASAMTVVRILVEPALRRRMGFATTGPRTIRARLSADLRKKTDRAWFVRGELSAGDPLEVRPIAGHGSADIAGAAVGDCLIHAPREKALLERGAAVDVVVWGRSW
ncbi:MAG: molybdopterin molybdotransferase MoeA [Proteobacteria bacterium]|nr:molybdopterin molybdotransferase MoeA [Pseudomonadota bacterium]